MKNAAKILSLLSVTASILAGCAGQQAQKSWQAVETERIRAEVQERGKLDRELVRLRIAEVRKEAAETQARAAAAAAEKIQKAKKPKRQKTEIRVPQELPRTRITTGSNRKFEEEYGEVAVEPNRVVEQVDHVALAIMKLAEVNSNLTEVALALAENKTPVPAQQPLPEQKKDEKDDYIARLLTERKTIVPHKQPENEMVAGINAVGKAAKESSSWITAALLGWFAKEAVVSVANVPSMQGNITENSNNPTTATTTEWR
ncbi:MAG: hypothetical protein ACL93V_10190 [Candidatus Electrothrix sp. YB6]